MENISGELFLKAQKVIPGSVNSPVSAQRVYLAPSPFEALFVSLAHNEEIMNKTIDSAFNSFKKL